MLTVVSLDPHNVQECTLSLDFDQLGIPSHRAFEAHDELSQETFMWSGPHPYVRLTPDQVAHVLHLRPQLGDRPA